MYFLFYFLSQVPLSSGIAPPVSEQMNPVQVTELLPQSCNTTAKQLCESF